jgi:hypothetical protein
VDAVPVAVTLVRNWVPVFAGVAAASGGLAMPAFAVSVITVSEKFTNMLLQPVTGRLSDAAGRSRFVFAGGAAYGLVALAVPFTPAVGSLLGLPSSLPLLGAVSAAFLPLLLCNAGLGVADEAPAVDTRRPVRSGDRDSPDGSHRVLRSAFVASSGDPNESPIRCRSACSRSCPRPVCWERCAARTNRWKYVPVSHWYRTICHPRKTGGRSCVRPASPASRD